MAGQYFPVVSRRYQGFTLIELIVVIVISGIIALSLAEFITLPIESYAAQSRRGELVDIADTALGRIGRELHQALPNSIRSGCSNRCLEYLRVIEGGKYRSRPDPGDSTQDVLDFTNTDDRFHVVGPLLNFAQLTASHFLVVDNTGSLDTDAYSGGNRAPLAAPLPSSADGPLLRFDNSGLTSGTFPQQSPSERFFIVDAPVSFICNLTYGSVCRYQGYSISTSQPTSVVGAAASSCGTLNGAGGQLLANKVSDCEFRYQDDDAAKRRGVASLRIRIEEKSEVINLLQQAHVLNLP